jgi:hypothetical protein
MHNFQNPRLAYFAAAVVLSWVTLEGGRQHHLHAWQHHLSHPGQPPPWLYYALTKLSWNCSTPVQSRQHYVWTIDQYVKVQHYLKYVA